MKSMTAMNATRKQAGFTIIELVVVILLLGILTATALPRFMDVTDEAHEAVVDAVTGGFTTGVALFRAQWVAEGQPFTTAVDEFDLYASATGYPRSKTLTSTTFTGQTTSTICLDVYNEILQAGGRPAILAAANGVDGENDAAREVLVEAVSTLPANSATDFVAVLGVNTTANLTDECAYYYVGQYKLGESGVAARTIPVITYNFSTGITTRGNATFETDQ